LDKDTFCTEKGKDRDKEKVRMSIKTEGENSLKPQQCHLEKA